MQLGTFSVSLAVANITKSKHFYETLGFEAMQGCGSIEDKWLMMKNGKTLIGLFEGMISDNILTFNPEDVRSIEQALKEDGVTIDTPSKGDAGPGHCIFRDPDGNVIMLDQF